jgi:hypothetical protein
VILVAVLALGKHFEETTAEIQELYNSVSIEGDFAELEAVLGRLSPIEAAIMEMPAHTIEGLGVKAQHVAYLTSEYWNGPIDRVDWDAPAVRRLIEAICESAGWPLPLQGGLEKQQQ